MHTPPLDSVTAESEISLLDILIVLAENLKLIVFGSLATGLLALGVTYLITPTYTATLKFLPPQQQQSSAAAAQSLGGLATVAGTAVGVKNLLDQYVAFLQSNSVRDGLNARFKLTEHYQRKLKAEIREVLDTRVKIVVGKDGLITILVDDPNPRFAAELANAHIDELEKLLSRIAVTEAAQRRLFFEKQLQKIKEDLIQSETLLKSVGIDESALKQNPTSALNMVAQLKAQIVAQEIKLVAMRNYLTESAPQFKQTQAELSALRNQLAELKRNDPILQGKQADYVAAYRDFKYNETLFELMSKQFELAKIDESRDSTLIQVVDTAEVPECKTSPKRALTGVLATLLSALLLSGFVLLRAGLRESSNPQWQQLKNLLCRKSKKAENTLALN